MLISVMLICCFTFLRFIQNLPSVWFFKSLESIFLSIFSCVTIFVVLSNALNPETRLNSPHSRVCKYDLFVIVSKYFEIYRRKMSRLFVFYYLSSNFSYPPNTNTRTTLWVQIGLKLDYLSLILSISLIGKQCTVL